jgi:hypothetical protein
VRHPNEQGLTEFGRFCGARGYRLQRYSRAAVCVSRVLAGLTTSGALPARWLLFPGVTTVHQEASSVRLRVEMPKWGDSEFVKVTNREVRTHKGVEYAGGQ